MITSAHLVVTLDPALLVQSHLSDLVGAARRPATSNVSKSNSVFKLGNAESSITTSYAKRRAWLYGIAVGMNANGLVVLLLRLHQSQKRGRGKRQICWTVVRWTTAVGTSVILSAVRC